MTVSWRSLRKLGGTTELLENLLLLARADAGHSPPELSDVEARAQLRDVCERTRALSQGKESDSGEGICDSQLSLDPFVLILLISVVWF